MIKVNAHQNKQGKEMKQDLILKLIEMLVNGDASTEQEDVQATQPKGIKERPIVVFANNCIIYGYSSAVELGDITINKAQYCYYYAKPDSDEKKGFMALAKYGPAKDSKVSSPVDKVTVNACCIIEATSEAVNIWENSKWKS